MTDARQNLLNALENSASDLDTWVRKQGGTVDELCQTLTNILQENGIAARIILDKAREFIPEAAGVEMTIDGLIKALAAIQSKQIGTAVPNVETASSEEHSKLEANIKDALPNLRETLQKSAKQGPQHRRGGRPEELADPEIRRQIREKIKARRDSGTSLRSIFKKLAAEYEVSETKIKRVWQEHREIT